MPGLDDLPPPPPPPSHGIPTGQGVANRTPANDEPSAGCIISLVLGTLVVLAVTFGIALWGVLLGALFASDQTWEGDPKEPNDAGGVFTWFATAVLVGGILLAWFVIVRGLVRDQRERRWQ